MATRSESKVSSRYRREGSGLADEDIRRVEDREQLKALMEYTKFHIGLYTTLCTLLVGVMGLEGLKGHVTPMLPYFIWTLIFSRSPVCSAGSLGAVCQNIRHGKTSPKQDWAHGFLLQDSGSLRFGSLPPSIPLFGSGPLSRCWES
jgi:hypothetical protein